MTQLQPLDGVKGYLKNLTQVVEVEWVLPRQGAVQPGLEEGGPAGLVLAGASAV